MTGWKKRGRNINGIDLQSSLSCIWDAGRNHTISAHCTTPMSFRSIGIDPCTKGLWLSGCVSIGRSHCLVLNFHHNTFSARGPVIHLQMTFILHSSTQSSATLVFTVCSHTVSTHFIARLLSYCCGVIIALLNVCMFMCVCLCKLGLCRNQHSFSNY